MTITNLTKKIIASMLKENTGRSILDSGGENGRHWQRNQARIFDTESSYKLEIDRYGIEYTKNIYHFLTENLEYNARLTNNFNSFSAKLDKYTSWFECLNQWLDLKIKKGVITCTSFYGETAINKNDSSDKIFCHYTYNEENCLSQDFQYYLFGTEDNQEIIALMIHGGCDARGGFTAPKFFNVKEDSFYMTNDCTIVCDNSDHSHIWDSDNGGYSWRYAGEELNIPEFKYDDPDLKDCQFIGQDDLIDNEEYQEKLKNQMVISPDQLTIFPDYHPSVVNSVYPLYLNGKLTIVCNDNKQGMCPLCGGLLV
jgi:hypothetical protein